MAKKKRKSYGYAIFLTVYVAVVLLAAYYVLSKVWVLAEEYENSRPGPVIEQYVQELSANLESSLAETISAMEHPMQTDEECIAVAKEMLSTGISYQRAGSTNGGRSVTYSLNCENGTFGRVEMHKDTSKLPEDLITFDKLPWFTEEELTPWTMGEAEFFFEGLYSSVQITVPETYPVEINGHRLGPDYIIEDDIHYNVLEDYYADYSGLPVKVTYYFDKYIGNMEPVIYDDEGNVTVIDSESDDSQFIKPCSAEKTDRLRSFSENFLTQYVAYTSGKYKNQTEYGYGKLKPYIKTGSDIDNRMKAAQDGIYYAHSPATILSAWLTSAIRLTDGVYLCEVGYTAGAETARGYEEDTVELRLIIEENNGDLRVVKEDR